MILLLSTIVQASEDLPSQIRKWTGPLNKTVVVATQDSDIKTQIEKIAKQNPNLPIIPENVPTIGDFSNEIDRIIARHNVTCLLFVEQDNNIIKIQDFGKCHPDKDMSMQIVDYQDSWRVYDHKNNMVDIHSFSKVCNDYTLQARLEQELVTTERSTKILKWTSTSLAIASIFPLKNEEAGFTAAEEDRLWTSVFLLATAAMVYSSQKIPNSMLSTKQSEVSNYYTKQEAQLIIDKRFPPSITVNEELNVDSSTTKDDEIIQDPPSDTLNSNSEDTTEENLDKLEIVPENSKEALEDNKDELPSPKIEEPK
jgi:hypothetical protein